MDSPVNAFVQAAEARSFTVAGWQFGVSSSAIGKAVAWMEERPKLRVFVDFLAANLFPLWKAKQTEQETAG